MRVSAYTNGLELVETQLSPERIVAAGIDPWRVDLFDSIPVKLKISGEQLNFRRLDDMAFTYSRGGRMFLCLHRSGQADCFQGTRGPALSAAVSLVNPRESGRRFEEHFLEYLTALERGGRASYKSIQFDNPMPASSLRLHGASLSLDPAGAIAVLDTQFTGTMFQDVPVQTALAEEINWLFEALKDWAPVVVGPALRKSALGLPVKGVHFCIDSLSLGSAFKHLRNEYGVTVPGFFSNYVPGPCKRTDRKTRLTTFRRNGCEYYVQPKAKDPLTFRFQVENHFSADSFFSIRAGEMIGSRIAIQDLSLRQARKMARHWEAKEWSREHQADLKEDGLTILTARDATNVGLLQSIANALQPSGRNRRIDSGNEEPWDYQ